MKKMAMLIAAVLVSATQLQAAEVTWQKDIKPLFDKHCLGCHGQNSPEHGEFARDKQGWTKKGIGMRMETYSHLVSYIGWPYTGALIRRLDDGTSRTDQKPGNMYEHLGATEVERQVNLGIFKAWVGSWNVKRWSDITKDELNAIKAAY